MNRGWLVLTVLLVSCANHESSVADAGPASTPFVHLLAWHRPELYGLGGLFGQSADGRVFDGRDLSHPVPALDGALGVTGGGSGFGALGSPPDSWICALVPAGVVCTGSNAGGELDPLHTQDCPNPSCSGSWGCLGLAPGSYRCVPDWSLLSPRGNIVQIHRTCAV